VISVSCDGGAVSGSPYPELGAVSRSLHYPLRHGAVSGSTSRALRKNEEMVGARCYWLPGASANSHTGDALAWRFELTQSKWRTKLA
jgi:hypothetical protein